MDILMAGIFIIVLAVMVAWIAQTHDLIWKWIKTQTKSLFHLVNASLQIAVKQLKEKLMECWDWSHWAALIVWTYVWHNWLSAWWSELWSWATAWWK